MFCGREPNTWHPRLAHERPDRLFGIVGIQRAANTNQDILTQPNHHPEDEHHYREREGRGEGAQTKQRHKKTTDAVVRWIEWSMFARVASYRSNCIRDQACRTKCVCNTKKGTPTSTNPRNRQWGPTLAATAIVPRNRLILHHSQGIRVKCISACAGTMRYL